MPLTNHADTLKIAHRVSAVRIASDQMLICAPMYNYSVPAVLKSWIH